MRQIIIFVSATFGNINVTVKAHPEYANTFEIGNKRVDFSKILPEGIDIRDMPFTIIIFDGLKAYANIIVDTETYVGTINVPTAKHEDVLAY